MVRDVAGPSRRAASSQDAIRDGGIAFDDLAFDNPRMVVPSPRSEKNVTWACFDTPNEATPLNPNRLVGDVKVSIQEMARRCFNQNLICGPFHIVEECRYGALMQ